MDAESRYGVSLEGEPGLSLHPATFLAAAHTGCRAGLRGPICRHSGLGGDSTLYLCRVQEFIPSWDTREPGAHSGRVSSDRTDGRGTSSLSLYNLPSCARNSSMKENLVGDEDRALWKMPNSGYIVASRKSRSEGPAGCGHMWAQSLPNSPPSACVTNPNISLHSSTLCVLPRPCRTSAVPQLTSRTEGSGHYSTLGLLTYTLSHSQFILPKEKRPHLHPSSASSKTHIIC